jgi:ERCC4-type nuclease
MLHLVWTHAVQVGDYVLSPEVVVERKALPDLFASLGSGRLYHQAQSMVKAYKTPMLLIEFDGDKVMVIMWGWATVLLDQALASSGFTYVVLENH